MEFLLVETLYVGDSGTEAAFAAGLGIPFAAVRWGYGNQTEMKDWPCTAWLEHPGQLLALLRQEGAGQTERQEENGNRNCTGTESETD